MTRLLAALVNAAARPLVWLIDRLPDVDLTDLTDDKENDR